MARDLLKIWRYSPTRAFGVDVVRAGLLVYGLASGCVAVSHYAEVIPDKGDMMQMRAEGVRESIRTLDNGGPPLAVADCGQYDYCALPKNDAPGIYLYLPVLGNILQVQRPELLLKWFFIGLLAPVVALYPLLMFEVLRSTLAAFAAPILVLAAFPFLNDSEIYRVTAWVVLLGVPLLTLAWQRQSRSMLVVLVVVMLIAGFASSIRALAGFPLLLSAIGIVLVRERALRRRAAFVGVCLAAYLAIAPGLTFVAASMRDSVISGARVAPHVSSDRWHQIYLGFGYLPNPYGIRYIDDVAFEAARQVDPEIQYLGPGYGDALRSLVGRIITSDPFFVVNTIGSKLAVVLWTALHYFWPALLLVPLMVRWSRRSTSARSSLVITMPSLLYGLVSPVLVMPYVRYQLTWLGACGYVGVLAVAWGLSALPAALELAGRALRSPDGRRQVWDELRPRSVRLGVISILAVVGVFLASSNVVQAVQERSFYWQTPTTLAVVVPRGRLVEDWTMAGTLPSGWVALPGVAVNSSDSQIRVTTNDHPLDYQLVGPTFSLDAGEYVVIADGEVITGGMQIGVLDPAASSWITQEVFWYGQFGTENLGMTAAFTLAERSDIRVILSNWRWADATSDWLVRRISIESHEQQ